MWPRAKRMWRLHLDGDNGSLQGMFVGLWADHYVLLAPEYVQGENQTLELDGKNVKVHRSRVLFIQEL